MSATLTIAIPTYNREGQLVRLLEVLERETRDLEGAVAVYVSDNASTDGTYARALGFADRNPGWTVVRNDVNVGPDENFCRCIEAVSSPYFWLLGDDDLPARGTVAGILDIIESATPDTVYLQARSETTITDDHLDSSSGTTGARLYDSSQFATRVNVWATFISAWIIRTDLAREEPLRRFTGTNLVQLGWILGAIRTGSRHVYVPGGSLVATQGNSGGYAVLQVFGSRFAEVVRRAFAGPSHGIGERMIQRSAVTYLPGLVWTVRNGTAGSFDEGAAVGQLRPDDVGGRVWFHAVLRPLAGLPKPLGFVLFAGAKLLARAIELADRRWLAPGRPLP